MARSWREIRAERNIDPQKIAEYREKMLQAIDAFPECAHIYFDFDFDGYVHGLRSPGFHSGCTK